MLPSILMLLDFAASPADAPAVVDAAIAHGIGKRQRVWHPYLTSLLGVLRAIV